MSAWPSAPAIYEIDTWPWLSGLERRLGRPLTLADVPGEIWDEVAASGLDAVWLMGVWERSPAGLEVARANESLQRAFRAALPDLTPADVVGSPYCVRRYRADDRFGGPAGLAAARAELNRRGLRLVLDYVPNHVAPDHPATGEHPNWFIQGTAQEQLDDPAGWFTAAGRVLAHGRDPYFPPWPDVAQLNAFDPGLREATAAALIGIGEQCDGVRCDMAMLVTNEIFARTWGRWAGPAPGAEFWPYVFERVRAAHPGLVLIAEAYWDMEWALQQQGFDFCYDKRLYDRMAHEDADSVRKHLSAGRDYQDGLLRFVENHDEPRAAATMPGDRARAAAIAIATLPGAVLWHDGQFEGRRTHLPVFLARYPEEHLDLNLRDFYRRLIEVTAPLRRGDWRLLDCHGWPDNPTHHDVLAWAWSDGDTPRHVIAINFGDHTSQGRIALPWPTVAGRAWRLTDLLDGRVFERDGDELARSGLYVDLPAWGAHVLAVE
ncbi:alpha-amylase family glycosyl hydrolase [Actinoplanes aureus]|uniref:Alpha-amylase n=1 Tax=Actinoplanes aureus TaxID=2792083 RepID=A0A931G1Z1_9ACTN|nr:alpha-amylase [Actinoplanes aureus]MBG0567162.1 alpha-amylase [Actinoplanes aureus]